MLHNPFTVHRLPLPAVRRSQPSVFNQLYLIGQPALHANGDIIGAAFKQSGAFTCGRFPVVSVQ